MWEIVNGTDRKQFRSQAADVELTHRSGPFPRCLMASSLAGQSPARHPQIPVLLILVNLFPVAGLLAFAKGFSKLAASMITIPLGIALVIGAYSHFFLSSGADNVFRMPPGKLRLPFQISALLPVILEALGTWVGLGMFRMCR